MTALPPLDPDPRYVEPDDLWDPEAGMWIPRPSALPPLLAGMIYGVILGLLVGSCLAARVYATPRSADQPVIPTESPRVETSGGPMAAPRAPGSSGNLADRPSGAPLVGSGVRPGISEEAGAPTSLAGTASWYDDGPGLYAAVHSWRWGDRRYQVRVSAGGRSVVVTVRDFCGCPGGRVIDLSPAAFRRLAPLSAGLVRVTVSGLGPAPTPPATETEP